MTDTVGIVQTVFGTLSICSCCLVIASYVLFSEIRRLRYIELVTYVSFCDIWSSFAVALGTTESGTFACGFQSLINSTFTLSGLFWSVVILYQVWLITVHGKILQDLTYFHYVCWGLPLFLSLLPLIELKYGNSDDSQHWCYLVGGDSEQTISWMVGTFFIWCWLAIGLNFYFLIAIIVKLKQMAVVPSVLYTTLRRLIGYPAIYTIAWLPMTVIELCQVSGYHDNVVDSDGMLVIITALAISPGLFQSIIYFSMNDNVRLKWYYLFYPMPPISTDGSSSEAGEANAEGLRLAKGAGSSDTGGLSAHEDEEDLTDESREIDFVGEPISRNISGNRQFSLLRAISHASSGFGTGFMHRLYSGSTRTTNWESTRDLTLDTDNAL
jgi:hypothetical protein